MRGKTKENRHSHNNNTMDKQSIFNKLIAKPERSPGLQIRVRIVKIFSLFLNQNICCGYSKELSQRDGPFEHPKHMLKLMGKKIITVFP